MSKTLAIFTPLSNSPPMSGFATVDIRNNQLILDFDDTSAESAIFEGIMPRTYDSSGLTVVLVWAATTAITGDVKWNVSFEKLVDLDTDSFAVANTVTETVAGTSGQVVYTELSYTNGQIDGIVIGDRYRLKVTRDAVDASDTMIGDAELVAVSIYE